MELLMSIMTIIVLKIVAQKTSQDIIESDFEDSEIIALYGYGSIIYLSSLVQINIPPKQ